VYFIVPGGRQAEIGQAGNEQERFSLWVKERSRETPFRKRSNRKLRLDEGERFSFASKEKQKTFF